MDITKNKTYKEINDSFVVRAVKSGADNKMLKNYKEAILR